VSKVKDYYSRPGDARGLKETPLNYSQAIDWDIRVFGFPILGSYNPIL
jgi:hypothetical protein